MKRLSWRSVQVTALSIGGGHEYHKEITAPGVLELDAHDTGRFDDVPR